MWSHKRLAQAREDLTQVHKGMIESRKVNEITSPTALPLRDRVLGNYRLVTTVLLGTVSVVMLIACVNVAALMLARGATRSREIGIRAALGASRRRIAGQTLTESLLLSAAGGLLGVGLGYLGLKALLSIPNQFPPWVRFDLDLRFSALYRAGVGGLGRLVRPLARPGRRACRCAGRPPGLHRSLLGFFGKTAEP